MLDSIAQLIKVEQYYDTRDETEVYIGKKLKEQTKILQFDIPREKNQQLKFHTPRRR